MSRSGLHLTGISTSFPRVSGDEPMVTCLSMCRFRFSPRERG